METTQDIALSAGRRSAKRWRMAAGLLLVIAAASLAVALTRPRHVERIPVLVREVSATQVAITSSAATHEAGPYVLNAGVSAFGHRTQDPEPPLRPSAHEAALHRQGPAG